VKRRVALLCAVAALALAGPALAQDVVQDAVPVTISEPAPEAATPAAPAEIVTPPPAPSRARPATNTDEGGLWGISDRAELQAQASGELERDPALNAYVRGVACRVAGPACGDVRLYIMNRPFFNASMAPNGYMEVWSGLMLRAEDESQLAFVLGHEITHYRENHSLELLRTMRGRATAAMIFSIGAAAAGVGLLGDLVYLGTVASMFGFSREREAEADSQGFDHAVAAGYDPNAGVTLWTNLIAEARVSDNPDVRRREARASVFASHPLSADRVEALQAKVATSHAPVGETNRERYRAAIRPFLDPWLRAELRRRDYGQTLVVLDRLASHGEDLGMVEYYRGEVYRLRRGDGDAAHALEHYNASIAQPDAPAGAWRELGDIAMREQRTADAAQFFTTYLERAPNASDRALVQARLAQVQGGNQ